MTPKTLSSLGDLKGFGRELKREAKAAEEKAREKARKAAQSDAAVFARAMAELGVTASKPKSARVLHEPPKPKPIARQREAEIEEILEESMGVGEDPVVFLESEDGLLFRQEGVPLEIPRKLFRGQWTVQAHIDLHGLFLEEARDALQEFLRVSKIRGYRCLRIVHGKGYGSVGGHSVLKEMVRSWLKTRKEVMAFVQAPPNDGDAGAVIVLLKPSERKMPLAYEGR